MGDISPSPTSLTPPSHRPATLPIPNPTASLWQTSHPSPLARYRSPAGLPTMTANNGKGKETVVDVVVIGSGITGVFCVSELISQLDEAEEKNEGIKESGGGGDDEEAKGERRGQREVEVLVLEARELCSGATGRNGGHLIPNVVGRRGEWEVKGCEDVEGLVRGLGRGNKGRDRGWGCEYRRVEGVSAWWDAETWEGVKSGLHEGKGKREGDERLKVRVVEDREGLRGLGLREGCVGALVQAWAATLSPYRLVTGLWEGLLRDWEVGRDVGVEGGKSGRKDGLRLNLQTGVVVERLRKSGREARGVDGESGGLWEVITSEGTVRARHVVVAVNGWTSALLKEFTGVVVPTQGQMTALRPPSTWEEQKRMLKHDYGFNGLRGQDRVMNDYVVHRPWQDGGHLMCGGGRQWVRGGGEGVSDDSYNDDEAVQHLQRLGEQLDLDGQKELNLTAAWTGVMGYSRDGCPWVGGVPGSEGLWISAGYTGHGMPNAPSCGRHVARLVAAALQGKDWREREKEAVVKGEIPGEFVLDAARLGEYERSSIA